MTIGAQLLGGPTGTKQTPELAGFATVDGVNNLLLASAGVTAYARAAAGVYDLTWDFTIPDGGLTLVPGGFLVCAGFYGNVGEPTFGMGGLVINRTGPKVIRVVSAFLPPGGVAYVGSDALFNLSLWRYP